MCEIVDVMVNRNLDGAFIQETGWKSVRCRLFGVGDAYCVVWAARRKLRFLHVALPEIYPPKIFIEIHLQLFEISCELTCRQVAQHQ